MLPGHIAVEYPFEFVEHYAFLTFVHFVDGADYANDMYDALVDADALALLTEWKQFRLPSWAVVAKTLRGRHIVDGRNIYRDADLDPFGLVARAAGDMFIVSGSLSTNTGRAPWYAIGFADAEKVSDWHTTSSSLPTPRHTRARCMSRRKALFFATQARENLPYYYHKHIGFNYRLSNICGAIGCGQMEVLPERVARRQAINAIYAGTQVVAFLEERVIEVEGYEAALTAVYISSFIVLHTRIICLSFSTEPLGRHRPWR